ncbi:MAG: hypothetical protein ACE5GX_14085 [Thermoanaerobaculia bacterium]
MSQDPSPSRDFWSGLVLIVAPLLSVFAMAHHPTAHGETTADRLSSMIRQATLGSWVHGALIALMVAIFIALVTFAGRLGWTSGRVRAGVIAYFVGVICMVGAALVSGFLVPGLAERYVDSSPTEMEASLPVFHLAHEANQALAKAGAVGMSTGIFFWSLVLIARAGWLRAVGAFGLAAGLLPILGLIVGRLHLDVHGMLAVVVAQALWQIAVGVWLLRGDA